MSIECCNKCAKCIYLADDPNWRLFLGRACITGILKNHAWAYFLLRSYFREMWYHGVLIHGCWKSGADVRLCLLFVITTTNIYKTLGSTSKSIFSFDTHLIRTVPLISRGRKYCCPYLRGQNWHSRECSPAPNLSLTGSEDSRAGL